MRILLVGDKKVYGKIEKDLKVEYNEQDFLYLKEDILASDNKKKTEVDCAIIGIGIKDAINKNNLSRSVEKLYRKSIFGILDYMSKITKAKVLRKKAKVLLVINCENIQGQTVNAVMAPLTVITRNMAKELLRESICLNSFLISGSNASFKMTENIRFIVDYCLRDDNIHMTGETIIIGGAK